MARQYLRFTDKLGRVWRYGGNGSDIRYWFKRIEESSVVRGSCLIKDIVYPVTVQHVIKPGSRLTRPRKVRDTLIVFDKE